MTLVSIFKLVAQDSDSLARNMAETNFTGAAENMLGKGFI